MKYFFSPLLLFIVLCEVQAQVGITFKTPESITEKEVYAVEFDQKSIDFGQIIKGEKRNGNFTFTNTGSASIKIELVSACECTTLDWTRGFIAPNEKGEIKVIFDTTEKEDQDPVDVDVYFGGQTEDDSFMEILNFNFTIVAK